MKKHHNDIENIIQNTSQKLNLNIDLLRDIIPQEIQYLLNQCPFLHIRSTEPLSVTQSHIIRCSTGWNIHDTGNTLSSSSGCFLFTHGSSHSKEKEQSDDKGGKGTIISQAWHTAQEMVNLSFEREWKGIVIVDGHPLMARAAWIQAMEYHLLVDGFKPNSKDQSIRQRINGSFQQAYKRFQQSFRNKK